MAIKKIREDEKFKDDEAHEGGGALGMTAGGVAGGIAGGVAATMATAATLGGIAAGPIGVVAGAAIGGALGGKAGEAIARAVNPTAEEAYWEDVYTTRPYVTAGAAFETYRPAYRYGVDSFTRFHGRRFEEVEPELRQNWDTARGDSTLDWTQARDATQDAYDRLLTAKPSVED